MSTSGTIDVIECVANPHNNLVHFVAIVKERRDFLEVTDRPGDIKITSVALEMDGKELHQRVTGSYCFLPDRWYATCDALHGEAKLIRHNRRHERKQMDKRFRRAYRARGWDYDAGKPIPKKGG